MKDTFSFFNMKGILQNLTGCYCLVLKWWQEGKKALTAHSPHPLGTILVSSGKKMEFLTTGSHGTVTQNKNLGAFVVFYSLCMKTALETRVRGVTRGGRNEHSYGSQRCLRPSTRKIRHRELLVILKIQNQRNEGFEGSQEVI